MLKFIRLILMLMLFLPTCWQLQAQVVTNQTTVVDYLSRMAQKGYIPLNDFEKPLDRKYVYILLDSLLKSDKGKFSLSLIEKQEAQFFIQLYQLSATTTNTTSVQKTSLFQKGALKMPLQPALLAYKQKDFSFLFNPTGELSYTTNSKNSNVKASGFQFLGTAGNRVGFQMSFLDVNEQGQFDSTKINTPQTGIVRKDSSAYGSLNYSQINARISYRFNKGMLTVGQDQQVLGYGKMGNIVLSDKSPAYPFFKINYEPTPWLRFNYMHAWLQSGILDSSKSYGLGNTVYGGKREQYIPKFYALHYAEIKAMQGLVFNVGESIVYSDQLEPAYLIPVLFFKAYDNNKFNNNNLAGANGQLFFGFNSRHQIKNTHLYGEVFIDEIRLSKVMNSSQSRNQLGYQLGASVTDIWVPYLTITAEYTKINPFVYRNLIPAQNYTQGGYTLGDWMGANADRLLVEARYHPIARLSLKLYGMQLGKGGQGTLEQQYFQQPAPKFGFNPQYQQTQLGFVANYEIFNNVYFNLSHIHNRQTPTGQKSINTTLTSFGLVWSKF